MASGCHPLATTQDLALSGVNNTEYAYASCPYNHGIYDLHAYFLFG